MFINLNDIEKLTSEELNKLKEKHSIITEVRGKGLFIGIEFGRLKKLNSDMLEQFMMVNIISKHHIYVCTPNQ